MTRSVTQLRVALPALVALSAISAAVAGCSDSSGRYASVGAGEGSSAKAFPARAGTVPEASGVLPAGWARLRLRSGITLPYPASWRQVSGDPGSASAASFDAAGTIRA